MYKMYAYRSLQPLLSHCMSWKQILRLEMIPVSHYQASLGASIG